MEIQTLKLRNFKGCRSFDLVPNGGNVDVYGDNGTFKTTLFDAFTWLLFDKDSANKKAFDIKTLDGNNQPLHGLDHEVEAALSIDGKTITLRKVYKEKWTKKRGSATAEFTGHTTDHFINGVPVSKKEYDLQIEQIASEDTFKLLTSPTYFNEHLHWQDRRKILLQVCGDISDDDVIASDKALAKLPAILGDHSMEELRKIIAARRAKINKELDKIPVRIDEVQQSLPDVTGLIPEELNQKIRTLKTRIKEKEQQITRIEGGGEAAEKTKALREIEGQLLELKNQHMARCSDKLTDIQAKHREAQDKIATIQGKIRQAEMTHQENQRGINGLDGQMTDLRAKWGEINSQEFTFVQEDTCPTCGQGLPAEKLAEAREKAMANFNLNKAQQLEQITAKGKGFKQKADELASTNDAIQTDLGKMRGELEGLEAAAKSLASDVKKARSAMDEYANDPEYVEGLQKKQELEQAITDLQAGNQGETTTIRAEINTIELEVRAIEGRLNDIDRAKQGVKRIGELQDQERKLAEEFEKLEEQLYLTEQFIRTKVTMLEERINAKFELARFKLFDVQINGGVVEVCETMYKGVPFSSLNNAARINVGLDIINTISDHYGFSAPIFVDNAEAVTELIETRGQLIRLIVSEQDKQLRVEYPGRDKELKEVV